MNKVGYTEEAPGIKSTMRLAVLAAVFSGCFVVVAVIFLLAFGREGPMETLVLTGGSMALSSQAMKALQKNIERRFYLGGTDERRTFHPAEPESGGDPPPEQGDGA